MAALCVYIEKATCTADLLLPADVMGNNFSDLRLLELG